MSAAPDAIRKVWITDGSLVPFDDVVHLSATHRSFFGLKAPYKGMLDDRVPTGATVLSRSRPDDQFLPEAEWCLLVPGGLGPYLQEPETLTLSTPVLMQGLIEGKWVNRLLGTRHWETATIGNNLLAAGDGISTTIGAIELGAVGEVTVRYHTGSRGAQKARVQRATLADVREQNLLGLVRAVLIHCRETHQVIDAINLGAMGPNAAVFNDRRRVLAAMRFARLPLPNPASLFRPYEVSQRVVRQVITEEISAVPGTSITLRVTDEGGSTVGEGTIDLLPDVAS
jgi:hypothetical protein